MPSKVKLQSCKVRSFSSHIPFERAGGSGTPRWSPCLRCACRHRALRCLPPPSYGASRGTRCLFCCTARIANQNWVNGNMTATIAWNLIDAYYPWLQFSNDGCVKL